MATLLTTGATCSNQPFVWVHELNQDQVRPEAYRIRVGDALSVRVWKQEQLSTEAKVRPDGKITVVLVGDVAVENRTPVEASQLIAGALKGLVVEPRVSVAVVEPRIANVSVLGEVRAAGRYPLEPGETMLHILAKSGGLTEFARSDRIFVVRQTMTPSRIRFSFQELTQPGRGLDFQLRDGDVVVVE